MKELDLLKNEQVITSSGDESLVLTSHRLRKKHGRGGNNTLVSILLRNISSIQVRYKENRLLVFLAIVCFLAALICLYENELLAGGGFVLLGLMFIYTFFKSRQHQLVISSKGGRSIFLHTKGMKNTQVLSFINKVEEAIINESSKHHGGEGQDD